MPERRRKPRSRPRRKSSKPELEQELKVLADIQPRPELKERIMRAIDKAMISRERYQAFRRTVAVIWVSFLLASMFVAAALLTYQAAAQAITCHR